MKKRLTFHGPGRLEVPGHFTLAAGESHPVSNELGEKLISANPDVNITLEDASPKSSGAKSQPEAREGEGQPTASTDTKE